jgi:hypothetical protein
MAELLPNWYAYLKLALSLQLYSNDTLLFKTMLLLADTIKFHAPNSFHRFLRVAK